MLISRKVILFSLMTTITLSVSAMNNKRKIEENESENNSDTSKKQKTIQSPFLQEVIKKIKRDPVNNELHLLALEGNVEKLKDLYEKKKDFFIDSINTRVSFAGVTPLDCAIASHNLNCIKFLLEYGASIKIKSEQNNSVFHFAATFNNIEAFKFFLNLENTSVDITNNEGTTPLHMAAELDNSEMVTWLLKHGASINKTTASGHNSMHIAATHGTVEVAKILAYHNKSLLHEPNRQNGLTPLHYAASNNKDKFIQWLVKQNVSLDEENNKGFNSMHLAALYNCEQAIQEIASIKNDLINKKSNNNYAFTPLYLAVMEEKSSPEFITLLINLKADINALSKENANVMHFASSVEIANQLLLHNGGHLINQDDNCNIPPIVAAIKNSKSDLVLWFLEKGPKIDAALNNSNVTLLHVAAYLNKTDLIKKIFAWIRNIAQKNYGSMDKFVTQSFCFLTDNFTYNNQALVPLKQEIQNLAITLLLCKKVARKDRKNMNTLLWIVGDLPKAVLSIIVNFTFDPEIVIEYLLNMKNERNERPYELATDEECIKVLTPKNN